MSHMKLLMKLISYNIESLKPFTLIPLNIFFIYFNFLNWPGYATHLLMKTGLKISSDFYLLLKGSV